ncbi:MAG: hypothetical protein JSS63_14530 [Bacteroidetes bacterium]|nr:hypothetical protein [Bacteroidota bacterium]
MKLARILLTLAVLITLSASVTKAEGINFSKDSDLAYQFKKEIKHMMLLPVYLKFEDKNLTGIAYVTITVKENGKIALAKVEGENKQLNSYVQSKINAINAWADKENAGKTFKYTIDVN